MHPSHSIRVKIFDIRPSNDYFNIALKIFPRCTSYWFSPSLTRPICYAIEFSIVYTNFVALLGLFTATRKRLLHTIVSSYVNPLD